MATHSHMLSEDPSPAKCAGSFTIDVFVLLDGTNAFISRPLKIDFRSDITSVATFLSYPPTLFLCQVLPRESGFKDGRVSLCCQKCFGASQAGSSGFIWPGCTPRTPPWLSCNSLPLIVLRKCRLNSPPCCQALRVHCHSEE